MPQMYQDAMAIVRRYGKPDLFITFTCNPKWPDIEKNVLSGQTSTDRPDLVARVFHMKLKDLLKDITSKKHIWQNYHLCLHHRISKKWFTPCTYSFNIASVM